MKSIEMLRYEMLKRVRDFGVAHGGRFSASTMAGPAFVSVAGAVDELARHAVSKMSTARGGAETRTAAREALLDRLDAVSRTAEVMAVGTPAIAGKFRLPDSDTDQSLMTAGRLFARDAEAFGAAFAAWGLPGSSGAELEALVARLEEAIRECEAGQEENTAARAGIEAALAAGTAAVHMLEVIATNVLRGDPAMTAAWQRARRVRYPHRGKRASGSPVAAPATASAAALTTTPTTTPAAPAPEVTAAPASPAAVSPAAAASAAPVVV